MIVYEPHIIFHPCERTNLLRNCRLACSSQKCVCGRIQFNFIFFPLLVGLLCVTEVSLHRLCVKCMWQWSLKFQWLVRHPYTAAMSRREDTEAAERRRWKKVKRDRSFVYTYFVCLKNRLDREIFFLHHIIFFTKFFSSWNSCKKQDLVESSFLQKLLRHPQKVQFCWLL